MRLRCYLYLDAWYFSVLGAGAAVRNAVSKQVLVLLFLREFSNACWVSIQEDDKPLEHVIGTFLRTFTKNDHFKVGCTICILLQDDLLTSSQVGHSFYYFYCC